MQHSDQTITVPSQENIKNYRALFLLHSSTVNGLPMSNEKTVREDELF